MRAVPTFRLIHKGDVDSEFTGGKPDTLRRNVELFLEKIEEAATA